MTRVIHGCPKHMRCILPCTFVEKDNHRRTDLSYWRTSLHIIATRKTCYVDLDRYKLNPGGLLHVFVPQSTLDFKTTSMPFSWILLSATSCWVVLSALEACIHNHGDTSIVRSKGATIRARHLLSAFSGTILVCICARMSYLPFCWDSR